jgi:hypothetical protein
LGVQHKIVSLAAVFNNLGQNVIPSIAAKVFPDIMTIVEYTSIQDTGGGTYQTSDNAYTDLPCAYEPERFVDRKETSSNKTLSRQRYIVTLPVFHEGARVDIDPVKHRFVVDERGLEPEKTFRIISIRDHAGVVFEAVCERENAE